MFKAKGLLLLTLLGSSLWLVGESSAQVANPPLNLQNSGSMGHVPTHTRPITSNVTRDLAASDAALSDEKTLEILGCGALDTHEARRSILNTDDSTINDYFSTNVSNYMVTTLFNSPAVAQIFNGLENFAGARVRELQDRCAAMEYKDDTAPVQWQAVQACIQNHLDSQGDTGAETVAQAFKFCLSSPDYNEQSGETLDKSLFEITQETLESPKWNGTLHSALQHTRICVETETGKDCSLLSLLPNIRWCTQSNIDSFGQCVDGAEKNISAESISPIQIFDATFGLTEGFTNYAMVYADELATLVGFEDALHIAKEGENTTGAHMASIASSDDIMDLNKNTLGADAGPGALDVAIDLETEFSGFVNCSAPRDGTGFLEWENFHNHVDGSLHADLPPPFDAATVYGDTLHIDFGSLTPDPDDRISTHSDLDVSDVNVAGVPNLMEYAVKCAMRDDIRLTLADYISLVRNDESKDAALLGYRAQVAHAATRNILRFVIHRLHLAQLDLGVIVSTDPKSPPPFVRNALDTLIGSFESRLSEMDERRKQQRDYAKMIAGFHEL